MGDPISGAAGRGRRKSIFRGHPRFVGVRQRPSARWVAEIKDSLQKVDNIEPFSFEEVCRSKGKEANDFLHALRAKLLDGKGLKVQLSPVMQTAHSASNNNNDNNHNAVPSMATALLVQDFGGEVGASDGGGVQWEQPAYETGWTRTGPMAMRQAPESAMFGVAAAAASAWPLPPVAATVDLTYSRDTPMDGSWSSEHNENGGWGGSGNIPWDPILFMLG
ncbi:hypothetical protein SLA2020_036820 [Shorea laevis]